ncbi:MAG: DEAD/DEAH box helicase [Vicinamibacterales bacterium]
MSLNDSPPSPDLLPGERLSLLQLVTREAMAARHIKEREQPAGAGATSNDEDVTQGGESAVTPLPEKWRLVPEGVPLHKWQAEALEAWKRRCRGTVKVATGAGKTVFALAVAEWLQNSTEPDLCLVVVVPTIPLMHQWRDELLQSNLPAAAVELLGGGQAPTEGADVRVVIAVLASARDKLPALARRRRWSDRMLLVVDECHRANAEQARRVFDACPRYTLGLSATPESDAGDEGVPSDAAYASSPVGQGLGEVIFEFTLRQSLEAGLLTPFEVWHVGVPLGPTEARKHAALSSEITELRKSLLAIHRKSRSKQGFIPWCQTQASRSGPSRGEAGRFMGLTAARKRLLYRAAARFDLLLFVLRDALADPETRGIVFHESIPEIEAMFLGALRAGLPTVLEHSQLPDAVRNDNIDAFRRGIARLIISARSLIEGFNVPSADLGVIAASNSSVRQRIQSLGRMLRKKAAGRAARVVVVYVQGTEDEAIYEKADWGNVLGAERNRYFAWAPPEDGGDWQAGLRETGTPPRDYRPPSSEVDVGELEQGAAYPGRPTGEDLFVDDAGNLRDAERALVKAPRPLIDALRATDSRGRARLTPAGHLIARASPRAAGQDAWVFLGVIGRDARDASTQSELRIRIRMASGRRELALEAKGTRARQIRFALSEHQGASEPASQTRRELLAWVSRVEAEQALPVREVHWDGARRYWLEIQGKQIEFEGEAAPLEFPG